MIDKKNSQAQNRILAFKLAKELKNEDLLKVSGSGGEVTHGWETDYTGPQKKADGNYYVADYR